MKSIFTFILVLFSLLSFGQFRNTKWGMTEKQVVKAESITQYRTNDYDFLDPLKRGNKYLSQVISIDNALVEITYLFENGKLSGGMYSFTPLKGKGGDEYLKLWEFTKNNLIKKYGEEYQLIGDSLNWTLIDQTIKAFFIETGVEEVKFINVIYDSPKLKQQDIL